MADDVELLRQYHRNHSEEAFAELVARHAGFVYGCALRRVGGDAQYAEDVTQAVFTRMAKISATLVQHPVLKGWLYTTTRHLAAATVRAERRRREREQKAYVMNEITREPDSEPAWAELRPVIDAAFEVLTAREREAVFLRFYEAREYADIGARVAVSADGARHRVDRALEKMRATLSARGVRSSTAALAAALTVQAAIPAPASLLAALTAAGFTAGASASSTFAFFTLMSLNKVQATIAAVILAGAIGFTTHEVRRHHAAERSLTTTQNELESLSRTLADAQKRAVDAAQRSAALQRTLQEAEARASATPANPASIDARAVENSNRLTKEQMVAAGREFLQTHPEAKQLLVRYTRTKAISGLEPFFQDRAMTPQQIAAFQDAMEPAGEFTFGQMTPVAGVSMTLSLSEGPPIPAEELNTRIRAVLGDEGFAAYQQFKADSARLMPARGQVEGLASDLYWTEEPLNADQAGQLMQIIAQSSPDYQAGKRINIATLDWGQLSAEAQRVLSPSQLRVLNESRDYYVYERTLNQAERDARKEWANSKQR